MLNVSYVSCLRHVYRWDKSYAQNPRLFLAAVSSWISKTFYNFTHIFHRRSAVYKLLSGFTGRNWLYVWGTTLLSLRSSGFTKQCINFKTRMSLQQWRINPVYIRYQENYKMISVGQTVLLCPRWSKLENILSLLFSDIFYWTCKDVNAIVTGDTNLKLRHAMHLWTTMQPEKECVKLTFTIKKRNLTGKQLI